MKLKKIFKRLEVQVVIALILAIISWIYLGELTLSISWIWVLFMKLLKTFLAPLLFLSVLSAVLWLWNMKKLWSIWSRTIAYYMLTTTLAITTSLILMNAFKPGKWVDFDFETFTPDKLEALSFSGFLLSIIPDNIVQSFVDLNAMQIVTMGIILWIALISYGKREEILQLKTLSETVNNGILTFISQDNKPTTLRELAIISWKEAQRREESIIKILQLVIISKIMITKTLLMILIRGWQWLFTCFN